MFSSSSWCFSPFFSLYKHKVKLKTAALCFLNTSEPLAVFGNAPIHFFFPPRHGDGEQTQYNMRAVFTSSRTTAAMVLTGLFFFFFFPHVDSIQILTQTEMEFSEGKTQNMERFPALPWFTYKTSLEGFTGLPCCVETHK